MCEVVFACPVNGLLHPLLFCGQKACRDVEKSEHAVEALQAEVSALKKKLQEKQRAAAGKAASKLQTYLETCFYFGLILTLCLSRTHQPTRAEEQRAAA